MVEILVLPEIQNVILVPLRNIVNIIKKAYINEIKAFYTQIFNLYFQKNIYIFCIFIYLFYILLCRGDFLTNINCSLNCIYQKDGKCSYSSITPIIFSTTSECTYFVDKSEKKNSMSSFVFLDKTTHSYY